ncbi:ankyrin repeat and LEM domain-containing protein 1 [Pleurodeles waltl]|uniref:ankyrin repeat and LEM domain-containing protein 1 n=1 Tax=Pleurodeles waltl TaxID=8319 RepID=UPI003709469F
MPRPRDPRAVGGPGQRLLARRLCEALENEDAEDVEALLKGGADPNFLLPEGIAPVHLASGKEREIALRCLNLVLQHGGNPNTRSVDGLTPLHVAASWGCSKCLKLLLKKGGDPTLEDQDGNRAFDLAIEQRNQRCALILRHYDPCSSPPNANGMYDDGYLEAEDSNDTTELSETYDTRCSDAEPLSSTRMSLQCTLPSRPNRNSHLSDTVIASHSQQPRLVESLPESMCPSDEMMSSGPQVPPLGTEPTFPVNSIDPAAHPSEHLFGAHLNVVNTLRTLDATDIPAGEHQSVDVLAQRIASSISHSSAKSNLTNVSQHSMSSPVVFTGSFSRCSGYAEAHHNTTDSTTGGEPHIPWEISGVCTLSSTSRGSHSATVSDTDTVLKSCFRGPSLTPEFNRSQGLDVTSPDHVYMFSHENPDACDLEKTMLDPRLAGTTNDERCLRVDLQDHSESDKYDSCHSECYVSTGEVSSYDSSHSQHFEESKADIASETQQDSSSLSGSKSIGPEKDTVTREVVAFNTPMRHSHTGRDFTAQGVHVMSDTSAPTFLFGKESETSNAVEGEYTEGLSFCFGNRQEMQRVCTAPGEAERWRKPHTTDRNFLVADSASAVSGRKGNPIVSPAAQDNTAPASQDNTAPASPDNTAPASPDNTAPASQDNTAPATQTNTVPATQDNTVPVTHKTAPATQDSCPATQDTHATDVPSRDRGPAPQNFDMCSKLKALMLSTKNHKSSFPSQHRESARPGQICNRMLAMGLCGNGVDVQEASSIPQEEVKCQSQDTLPVDVCLCKNGSSLNERPGKLSITLQPRGSLERESQPRSQIVGALQADYPAGPDASAGTANYASLSCELRRMMFATKTAQSPLSQQSERPCHITPRTKSRVTSSSSRNSSSSLFDDSLEMPQRGPRIFSPARRCKSPHARAGMADNGFQEERPLSQDAGIFEQFPETPTKGMEPHSLDDTVIIEEHLSLGTLCCKTSAPETKEGVSENRSSDLFLDSRTKAEGACSGLDWCSQTVILRSPGTGRTREDPLDDSNSTLLLRSQSTGCNGNDLLADSSVTVPLRAQGFVGSGGNDPDDSDATVLLPSLGGGGLGGNEPDDTILTALIKPQGNCNFSDFFTDDKSSSFTDERMPFAVHSAGSRSAPLISDTESNMSDNTWMTEDGDHSGAAPHLIRASSKCCSAGIGPNKCRDVCHSTLLYPHLGAEEEASPLRPRYSFSRLSTIPPSDPVSAVSNNLDDLYPVQDLPSFNLTLSPGGRPVSTGMNEPIEYLYMDPEEGHALIERHYPCTDDSTQDSTSSNDTIIYDWTTYKSQLSEPNVKRKNPLKVNGNKISPELYRLSNDDIMAKLRELGENPGPVTSLTRRVYLALLDKLMKDPQTKASQSEYSPELTLALRNFQIPDCTEDEMILSRQFDKPDKNVKWREGVLKSSFNYLLLDPRVTRNLPCRCLNLSQAECFRTFISAVFYVGKGKRSRPYSHLYEALTHYKTSKKQACPKVQHILDIWQTGLGVVSLHCFQNAIPVEAYTREACMVDAIGIKMLTNQKKGNYYGYSQDWPMKRRRRLGVLMLHRAMQIFLAEGERQLRPADIRIGQ